MKDVTFKDVAGYLCRKAFWILVISLILVVCIGVPLILFNLGYDRRIDLITPAQYQGNECEAVYVTGHVQWAGALFGKRDRISEIYFRIPCPDDINETHYYLKLPEMEETYPFNIGSIGKELEEQRQLRIGNRIIYRLENKS